MWRQLKYPYVQRLQVNDPRLVLVLIRYSAKPLLGYHALVWMVGFRMAGLMLSGSGIRVFVLGNMGLGWGGWEKVQVNDGEAGGVEGNRGGSVCVVYCCLKASILLWVNTLYRSSGKEAVFQVVVGGGYLSVFVWVDGSCLAVSGHEVLVGIDV